MSNVNWSATQNKMIQHAFWRIGVVPYGEQPDSEQQAIALFELNSLMKFLMAKNMPLWNDAENVINTIAGVRGYSILNTDAIAIKKAWYTISDIIYPLAVYAREEYESLTDRLVTRGTPTSVYFDRSVNAPTIYLYPIPDGIFAVTVKVSSKMKDWEAAATNASFDVLPQWWIEPVIWKLAANLSHVFRLPLPERDRIEAKADGLLKEVFVDNFKSNDMGEVHFDYV